MIDVLLSIVSHREKLIWRMEMKAFGEFILNIQNCCNEWNIHNNNWR